MKKLFSTMLVICSIFSSALHAEDESRDFGIRAGIGALQGIDKTILKSISVYADMYLLNPSTRMLFGLSMYNMGQTGIPTMSLQSIGVEQNFTLPVGQVFLGALYNKTYLYKSDSRFDLKHGFSFHAGYKYPLQNDEDLVFTLGQQFQPLKLTQASSIKLNDKTWYARIAMQWYF